MLQRELLRFADELEIVNFRAVSPGIGLGSINKTQQAEPARWHDPVIEMPPAAAAAHTRSRSDVMDAPGSIAENPAADTHQINFETAATTRLKTLKIKRPSLVLAISKSFARIVAIFVVDSAVVALSLAIALAVAGAALGIKTDGSQAGIAGLSFLAPIKWLAGFSIVQVLAGFYGVFIVYALTLRIVAGGTLGQALFRSSDELSGVGAGAGESYRSAQNVTSQN